MRRFATLYEKIDATHSTTAKVDALYDYFRATAPADSAWALYFLTGRKLKRLVPTAVLRNALSVSCKLPDWLIEESYAAVGDLAETIALLLPEGRSRSEDVSLQTWVEERLLPLRDEPAHLQQAELIRWWEDLSTREIFILNKLLTGSLRVGVSQSLVVKALARLSEQTEAAMAHRLMGTWDPTAAFFEKLVAKGESHHDPGVPYPFYLASPLEGEPAPLGPTGEWLLEWKWDGIRAQGLRRPGGVFLWSRGEELITERFPEISQALANLPPGTVLDGEILAFKGGKVLPFAALQQRIGRKKLTASVLNAVPVTYMVFDLLEFGGEDWRHRPLHERRAKLTEVLNGRGGVFQISPQVQAQDWPGFGKVREQARERSVEGLMLKRLNSPYKAGRRRGDWWKWKVDPFTMDAVLVYAQPGHGRRATLYTDYTFAIWKGTELVPIAKAYSGLTDDEILAMDKWIRAHTLEKFGPVRQVSPDIVFELAFEAVARSPRHKSGLAVRFPRILRKRDDKKPKDADDVEKVRALIYGT